MMHNAQAHTHAHTHTLCALSHISSPGCDGISLTGCFSHWADGELNVLEDILTEAPDHDDELYNPESERDVTDKKGTKYCSSV